MEPIVAIGLIYHPRIVMKKISANDVLNDLVFPIHDMLNLPDSTELRVENVTGPTTALTLRVTVAADPGEWYFIKTLTAGSDVGAHLNLGLREVRFYQLIESLALPSYPNIPKFIRSFIADDESNYYLVLEDMSASHKSYDGVDFSHPGNWTCAISALAAFHQRFTHRLAATHIQAYVDTPADVEVYIEKLERAVHQFKVDHRGLVDESVLTLMTRLLPSMRTFELEKAHRVHQNKLTTILHRDAHLKNFLYPQFADDRAVIVDWQFWGLGIGTYDLRHLLGSALHAELRSRQQDLVRFYYDAYTDGLDVVYSWDECWLDYQKGIIDNLFMPVWQYTGFGWDYERWGKNLKVSVENYYTLNCDQIT